MPEQAQAARLSLTQLQQGLQSFAVFRAHDPEISRLYVCEATTGLLRVYDLSTMSCVKSVNLFSFLSHRPPRLGHLIVHNSQCKLYASDQNNHCLHRFLLRKTNSVRRVSSFGCCGRGLSELFGPSHLAVDESGNRLFVCDTGNNRIVMYDTDATLSEPKAITFVGMCGTTPGAFNWPSGLAFDSLTGSLFVGDRGNCRIQGFSTAENLFKPIFCLGQFGNSDGDFCFPESLAFDEESRLLFVSEGLQAVLYGKMPRVQVFHVSQQRQGNRRTAIRKTHISSRSSELSTRLLASSSMRLVHSITLPTPELHCPHDIALAHPGSALFVFDSITHQLTTVYY